MRRVKERKKNGTIYNIVIRLLPRGHEQIYRRRISFNNSLEKLEMKMNNNNFKIKIFYFSQHPFWHNRVLSSPISL